MSADFSQTLNLPRTDFPMRPQANTDDPLLLEQWEQEGLYAATMQLNEGETRFVLHVGPPYANGHIHLGHAYNFILKDIVTKSKRMAGFHVPVVPGWDCHGLPIEQKVMQEKKGISALAMKQACRAYAQEWVTVQKLEFRRLGILMDWDHAYSTMSPQYEAATVQALGIMSQRGFLTRNVKTVAWCPTCVTTLASAEIEYQERKDPSIYIRFPLTAASVQALGFESTRRMGFLVWTTTPWTIPLNRAVAIKPESIYALLRIREYEYFVSAEAVSRVVALLQVECEVVAQIAAEKLQGLCVEHPFIVGQKAPIIYDEMISMSEGTACVHVAPGCGPSDYELGVKNCLEIFSPITPEGQYGAGIIPAELEGKNLSEGQGLVIRLLEASGALVHKGSVRHSYPHCWRCHQGLIFRATKQWFVDLKHENLQQEALQAVESISFIPPQGRQFLKATVGSRWEWCVSRQRTWGVPIPALLCTQCDTAVLLPAVMERVVAGMREYGIEYWDRVSAEELAAGTICACCGNGVWKKEQDILDVWFDSGVSHFAVLRQNPELGFPADLYLEGIDQYRGWFQSSLLTSVMLSETAPMKAIMSHGFTVDEKGQKMSKSLGNVISPQQIIDRLGTDGLRLWVASVGHDGDIAVSERLLENVAQVYRKIRNTCRFLLQNLYDFDPARDLIVPDQLLFIDRLALHSFVAFSRQVEQAYACYNSTAVFHACADYCTTQLSALYLDMVKDRLYVEAAHSRERRSTQTVLWHMIDGLTRLLAPILSFTAEQVSRHYPHAWKGSVHLQRFADVSKLGHDDAEKATQWWNLLVELRSLVMKLLEEQRSSGMIKHSLQAAVTLHITPAYSRYQEVEECKLAVEKSESSLERVLQDLCVVSSLRIITEREEQTSETQIVGIYGKVQHASGSKCARCWQLHIVISARELCNRCERIVTKQ